MTNVRVDALRAAFAFIAAIALSSCARDVTAPRVLRVVPSIEPQSLVGVFTDGFAFSSNGKIASVGTEVTITVKVLDQDNNSVPGVDVSWNIVTAGGSLSAVTVVSDSIGNASTQLMLDTIAKVDSVRASIPQGASTMMWATGSALFPSIVTKITADSQSTTVGAVSVPLSFRIGDRYGNPNANIAVAWIATGGGMLNAIVGRTDARGIATVNLIDAPTLGTYQIIATLGVLPALVFTVTAK